MAARSRHSKTSLKPLIVAAGIAVLFVALYLLMVTRLVNLGQSKAVYLIALVPLAASAATFMFLAGGSSATYVGKVLGGKLRLVGPPVVFFGILYLGLAIPETRAFTQAVRLKLNSGSASELSGKVVLALPKGDVEAIAGSHGTATFTGIPREYAGQDVTVSLEVKGYRLSNPGQKYKLGEIQALEVPIERDVVALVVRGYVLNAVDQKPVEGASVTISDQTVLTDARGWFEAKLPPAAESRTISLRVLHERYQPVQLDAPALREDASEQTPATILLTPV